MADFGKLIGGKIYYAPNILNNEGKQFINPPDDLYLQYGYLPLEYTVIPDMKEGYHVVSSWINVGDKLLQTWNYEADIETSVLINRLRELEEKVGELTFSLKKISENVIEIEKKDDSEMENGDYLNPIQFLTGMFVKTGLWYTDGEDIWEALKDGTPTSFTDREYFDIIG